MGESERSSEKMVLGEVPRGEAGYQSLGGSPTDGLRRSDVLPNTEVDRGTARPPGWVDPWPLPKSKTRRKPGGVILPGDRAGAD